MATTVAMFNYGTQAEFDAAVAGNIIVNDSLYFITDTQRIYRGQTLMSMTSIFYPTAVPTVAQAKDHTMYIVDGYAYIKIDEEMVCINHELVAGAINSLNLFDADTTLIKSTDTVTSTDDKLMTAGAVVGYVGEQVTEGVKSAFVSASFGSDTGNMTFGKNEAGQSVSVPLTGVVHSPVYDSSAYKLTIPVYGSDDIVVNLPKCVKSGRYEPNYKLPDGTYGPAIVLVVDAPGTASGEDEIVIPAASLIQIYTGAETDSIKVTVKDDKSIEATLKINPSENKIVVSENGLALDLSDYALKANPADVDKIAIINTDGNFVGSKKIAETYDLSDTDLPNKIPVFGVVSAAIANALGSIIGTGASDMVILSTESGVTRSNYKIGGDTINFDTEDNLLATEAAVIDLLSWKPIASE